MNGSLQELVDLYVYQDAITKFPQCEVYFKGRLEPFGIVPAVDLLGDLLLRSLRRKLDIDDEVALLLPEPWQTLQFEPSDTNLESVAGVIVDSSRDTDDDKKFFLAIIEFLEFLEKQERPFSSDMFNVLLLKYGLYLPPGEALDSTGISPGEYGRIVSWKENRPLSGVDFMSSGNSLNLAFHFECDTYGEVIISLLRYISIIGGELKRCQNCGKWFIPIKKRDEKYCMRLQDGKTCRDIAIEIKRRERLNRQPVSRKYNSVRTNIYNRVQAGKINDSVLSDFSIEYKERKKHSSDDEMMNWLSSIDFNKMSTDE